MRRTFVAALATLLLAPQPQAGGPLSEEPTFAGVPVFYGPADGFETVDARLLAGARRSIDMAAYVLTDRAVATALGRAAMRGSRFASISTARKPGAGRRWRKSPTRQTWKCGARVVPAI